MRFALCPLLHMHPKAIDLDIPKINSAGILSKFRTYVNLNKTENGFKRLLCDFHFSSISECFLKTNEGLNEDS